MMFHVHIGECVLHILGCVVKVAGYLQYCIIISIFTYSM